MLAIFQRWPHLDRLWAVGRDTYIRFYPNPGVGVCIKDWRCALSWYGGFEVFQRQPLEDGLYWWKRSYSLLSRVKRPGGK